MLAGAHSVLTRADHPIGRVVRCSADWLFDNSARTNGTYDVAAAYRLARADVWVRLPLGAMSFAEARERTSVCGKVWPCSK